MKSQNMVSSDFRSTQNQNKNGSKGLNDTQNTIIDQIGCDSIKYFKPTLSSAQKQHESAAIAVPEHTQAHAMMHHQRRGGTAAGISPRKRKLGATPDLQIGEKPMTSDMKKRPTIRTRNL